MQLVEECIIEIHPFAFNPSGKDIDSIEILSCLKEQIKYPSFAIIKNETVVVECPQQGFIIDLPNFHELRRCTALLRSLVYTGDD